MQVLFKYLLRCFYTLTCFCTFNCLKMETSKTTDNFSDENESNNILCIINKNGKLGAAYYSFNEKLLYVYEDMIDIGPQFLKCFSIYREANPTYNLIIGQMNDELVKILIDTIKFGDSSVTSNSAKSLPPNFFLLPPKEYSYDICKNILYQLNLSPNSVESNQTKRELYLHSMINFDHKMSVHATGALVKYLEKNWNYFEQNKEDLQFLHINQISIKDHLLMDWTSFNALQIFQKRSHESNFKRGLYSSSREGLSIYKIFSLNCKSKLGQICLRDILLNPLNDLGELNARLDFIDFISKSVNYDFVESLRDNIKQLSDIHLVLVKIRNFRADNRDWEVLYKTIYHTVLIYELSAPYAGDCRLFAALANSVTTELIGLEHSIRNALDFTNKNLSNRPVIKFGVDETLDAKKLRRQDMNRHVTAAAKLAVEKLPSYLNECAIVYLPEMGHLIAIKEWAYDCNPEDLKDCGFQFMFKLHGTINYKNPICLELDRCLGDINLDIVAHENRILQRLSGFVFKYNKDIRTPLKIVALMDCLISIGKFAIQNNYVRPNLNDENFHDIRESRHPLMELACNVETNDFCSGRQYSHIKVITGPNGSGKSIYLKQVTLIVYLAHIGSYVPAKKANIGMVHSIYTRIHATESASVRLSAFMIDLIQASQALNNARPSSLVMLDEFGRGTAGIDGFALLLGILTKFHSQNEHCPHVVVSTHFQNVKSHLPQSRLVDHLKMNYIYADERVIFLYKLVQGVSSSFALEIAAELGLEPEIIARAKEIFFSLKNGRKIYPIAHNPEYQNVTPENLESFLNNVNVPHLDDELDE